NVNVEPAAGVAQMHSRAIELWICQQRSNSGYGFHHVDEFHAVERFRQAFHGGGELADVCYLDLQLLVDSIEFPTHASDRVVARIGGDNLLKEIRLQKVVDLDVRKRRGASVLLPGDFDVYRPDDALHYDILYCMWVS